jgi:hypothetical protein
MTDCLTIARGGGESETPMTGTSNSGMYGT